MYHHKGCGGDIVNDGARPVETWGPYGPYGITATVVPQCCARCGAQLPANIDQFIEEKVG